MFHQLPEVVNRFLMPPDPVILHYTLNPAIPPPEKPGAWDVEVKLDDSTLKGRMNHAVVQLATETARELSKLDEEVRRGSCTPCAVIHAVPLDCHARPVAQQCQSQAHIPPRFRGGPAAIHPDLACLAVARPGDNASEWS